MGYWEEKRNKLISQLPTLLDILDQISLREELFYLKPSHFKGVFPTHYQEGMFSTMLDADGRTQLWPMGLLPFTYYRGQSQYFPLCKPSLYRKGTRKNPMLTMTPSKVFLERLRACELELVMQKHPMNDIFHYGTRLTYPDGTEENISLSIDYLALAQHYGICTELLDLTVDKWVAAFFACTKYVNGEYKPVTDANSYGVFYEIYEQTHDMMPGVTAAARKIRAIGLQPFSRPGEQAGFVYTMTKEQNFNRLCNKKIKFRHDPKVSELIFNYANRSKKLFPYELLQEKAEVIKSHTTFSRPAYNMAIARYFSDTPFEQIDAWCKDQNIHLQDQPLTSFTDEERATFMKAWPQNASSFYSRIYVRYSYTGPMKEVSKEEFYT